MSSSAVNLARVHGNGAVRPTAPAQQGPINAAVLRSGIHRTPLLDHAPYSGA